MNISYHGLHHKTFQRHMPTLAQASKTTATTMSGVAIKELYKDSSNLPGNIDTIYDDSWMTRDRCPQIHVGCIVEPHTGLIMDHVMLSNP